MASALLSCHMATQSSAQMFARRCTDFTANILEDGCSTSYSKLSSFQVPQLFLAPPSRPVHLRRNAANIVARAVQDDVPPPVSSEIEAAERRRREFWDSKNADPLADKGEFIWRQKWRERLDFEEQQRKEEKERENAQEEGSYGFLSLSRPLMLDSVDVDLTQELQRASRKRQEDQEATAATAERSKYRAAPTRREMKAWAKAGKNATGLQRQLLEEAKKEKIQKKLDRREEQLRYDKLKDELQLFTVAIGLCCLGATYVKYDIETAVSYAGGLVGALVYLRMLSSSVDNLGGSGGKAAARSALGQPRLLVPVVLVMAFNRWNALAAPNVGIELHLIPMLVGFFTYKLSTLLQTFRDLFPDTSAPSDTS